MKARIYSWELREGGVAIVKYATSSVSGAVPITLDHPITREEVVTAIAEHERKSAVDFARMQVIMAMAKAREELDIPDTPEQPA